MFSVNVHGDLPIERLETFVGENFPGSVWSVRMTKIQDMTELDDILGNGNFDEIDVVWDCLGTIIQFHDLLQCLVYSWAWECNHKLNDQPIREWDTASRYCLGLLRHDCIAN